jgi:hypothetical protein
VFYSDIGFNTAPYNIQYNFKNDIQKIQYKNNFKPFLGVGFAYKWFSLRVALPILGYFRDTELYGETKQYSLGFDFLKVKPIALKLLLFLLPGNRKRHRC